VYGKNYFNKFADESGHKKIVHYISKDLIEKYYDKTAYYPIFKLKPEFGKRQCVKDKLTGEWKYVE